MSFQLKDFVSIAAAMINRAKATQDRVTDFNVGSVARTLIEAPAIEIEEFYQRMFAGIMDAIPVSIYRGFNFDFAEPTKARGTVLITFGGPLETTYTVPGGSVFINPVTGYRYLAVSAVSAAPGSTSLSVVVDAEREGAAYNASLGAITATSGLSLPVGASLSNYAITSGSDGETEVERASRFIAYIQSISRGTTFSVEYAASTAVVRDGGDVIVESVSRVGSIETPGYVQVFIHGADVVASTELIEQAQRLIDGYFDTDLGSFVPGYRPIGVDVVVMPMVEQAVNMTLTVEMASGYDLTDAQTAISAAVEEAIAIVLAGDTLYVDAIRNAVLSVEGVASVSTNLTSNSLCPANIVFTLGTITFVDGGV